MQSGCSHSRPTQQTGTRIGLLIFIALKQDLRPPAPRPCMMTIFERTEDELMGDVFVQDDLSPTIAEHASQCRSIFHKYMVMPKIVPDPTVIDDQLARFSLWTSNMDVYGPLNVSLDYRLRFSPLAADIIHQLLDIICDTLLSCEYDSYCIQTD